MADCGASGSTIDRVASTFLQGDNNVTNAVSSFVSGTAIGHRNTNTTVMPAAMPNTLSLLTPQPSRMQPTPQQQQPQPQQIHPSTLRIHHPQQHHPQQHHHSMMQHHHQLQMQMQMQMQFQMTQQMQNMQRMQQQQQQQQKQSVTETTTQDHHQQEEVHDETVDNWHNDLEQEFQEYLETRQNNNLYDDEGLVDDVTIEKLAAAWEEANAQHHEDDIFEDQYAQYQDHNNNETLQQPEIRPYEFSRQSTSFGRQQQQQQSDSNQLLNDDTLLQRGIEYFHQGNLTSAILSLESHLQNRDSDSSDAWLYLGKCHAENDEDVKAIACLQRAIERDPFCTEALLGLGVSYVNELDYDKALVKLTDWVTHHPDYAGLELTETQQQPQTNAPPLEKLKQLLHQAIDYSTSQQQQQHQQNHGLAHVLEALGVVCNVSREFDQAVDAFRRALDILPEDYQLWNKLGATLANSNQSEDALPAYHQAISLKPKYARAWLNMAISHSNLQNHHEAIRCYLQTLSLNNGATHVWSYLRISLTCAEKWDLFPLIANRDLDGFKQHYDFVTYDD